MRPAQPGLQDEDVAAGAVNLPAVEMAPTRSSFLTTWGKMPGAVGYLLDVSLSRSFATLVSRYSNLDVGNTNAYVVSGLQPGTHYNYRVQSYDSFGTTCEIVTGTATTASGSGLVINPTFDSSIINDPDAAAIQSTIIQGIAFHQSLFSDPITVEILFRYANTRPDGTPIPENNIARSNFVFYDISWNTFVTSLNADAGTSDDVVANASITPAPLTDNVLASSANGRAIGLYTPPAMFADGTVAVGGPHDGIVTLNSDQPLKFTRPVSAGSYDALRSTEHEIDEVLGFGSQLDSTTYAAQLRPEDLFSWAAPGIRNTSAIGLRYFSINSGSTEIVGFNQDSEGDFGDWLSEACPQVHPYVQNAFSCTGQFSDVTSSSPEAIGLDVIGYNPGAPTPTPTPGPTSLGNISTRLAVKTGDQVLIAGFIIVGTEPKNVIVRAIGPSLPVPGALSDPLLELHFPNGSIVSNDDWRSDQEAEIIATTIPPISDKESAIVTTLNPGSYTAIVKGANGETGVGLVEVYDLGQATDSTLANISTRGFVQTGDNVLIGGLIVLGNDPTGTLVRAIGPSLPLSGTLADPMLELHDAQGRTVVSNDDWRSNQEGEIIDTGIPPDDDAESAIFAILAPGNYTAIVRGKNDTSGIALVEVYQLD